MWLILEEAENELKQADKKMPELILISFVSDPHFLWDLELKQKKITVFVNVLCLVLHRYGNIHQEGNWKDTKLSKGN